MLFVYVSALPDTHRKPDPADSIISGLDRRTSVHVSELPEH
jgi:hypothetical protein